MDIAKLIDENPWVLNIIYSMLVIAIALILYIYTSHLYTKRL